MRAGLEVGIVRRWVLLVERYAGRAARRDEESSLIAVFWVWVLDNGVGGKRSWGTCDVVCFFDKGVELVDCVMDGRDWSGGSCRQAFVECCCDVCHGDGWSCRRFLILIVL